MGVMGNHGLPGHVVSCKLRGAITARHVHFYSYFYGNTNGPFQWAEEGEDKERKKRRGRRRLMDDGYMSIISSSSSHDMMDRVCIHQYDGSWREEMARWQTSSTGSALVTQGAVFIRQSSLDRL